jgi:hypothetical protein
MPFSLLIVKKIAHVKGEVERGWKSRHPKYQSPPPKQNKKRKKERKKGYYFMNGTKFQREKKTDD